MHPEPVFVSSAPTIGKPENVIVIGAGPAGLTAAYELAIRNIPATVLEADGIVGGISRTAEYRGFFFDMGGHRFFTKAEPVARMWREILGDDLLRRPRLSRIYYNGKLFQYPLQPVDAFRGLGILEAARCGFSYLKSSVFPMRPEDNLEAWVSNRFGKRLFSIFFKSYTEKVWGMPCRTISAEWAAQRIRGLSLKSVLSNALLPKKRTARVVKTLIQEFDYPRKGPGMMWTKTRERIESKGGQVVLNAPVEKVIWEPGAVKAVVAGGRTYRGDHFVCSMPIRDLILALDPVPDARLLRIADSFRYRNFLTVALIIRAGKLFPDNWIYIHNPQVHVGRIQNYKNWSPDMVPDSSLTCLGMEYFCTEGDALWSSPDEELIRLATKEVDQLHLAAGDAVIDGKVERVKKAYPIYNSEYKAGLAEVRRFLEAVPNLQLVGRNGMHRYNNQDHSMLTAMLAVRNILGERHDLWAVNADDEYHEEERDAGNAGAAASGR